MSNAPNVGGAQLTNWIIADDKTQHMNWIEQNWTPSLRTSVRQPHENTRVEN